MRSCHDLDDDALARPRDVESCGFNNEVRRWVLVNDLIPVTLRNSKARDHRSMNGVQQPLISSCLQRSIMSTRMSGICIYLQSVASAVNLS